MMIQLLFFTLIILLISGNNHAHDVPYDPSFTHECLAKPLEPQYGGGIFVNPDPKQSEVLNGWIKVGNDVVSAKFGNNDSTKLKFQLEADMLYTFSGWVQASKGNAFVQAVFKTSTGDFSAGWVAAQEGCWSMLKGGLVVNISGPTELYFQSDNSSTTEIWASSISLQPFTDKEWKSHQDQSIEKVRKGHVKIRVTNQNGQPIKNATVFINQTRPEFPLGCTMNTHTIRNETYKNWFISRFKHYTVFENEFRWHYIAINETTNNYTSLDTILNFTKSHGLAVRGHPIHTSAQGQQPPYIINNNIINDRERYQALVNERTRSFVGRYSGQVMHWDVVNEMLNDDFLEAHLGDNFAATQYQMVHEIDPKTPLFLNEFYAIANSSDVLGSPWKYMQKIWKIRKQGYNGPLGIGVAGRFLGHDLNLPYVRASLDVLASLDLPIWITELLVSKDAGLKQAAYLEQIMVELHAHRAVDGIMIWAAKWDNGQCWHMCLTDNDFVNLETGNVVDKLMAEWNYASGLQETTDVNGSFESSLYYGEYEAQVSHPTSQTPITSSKFKVAPNLNESGLVLEIRV